MADWRMKAIAEEEEEEEEEEAFARPPGLRLGAPSREVDVKGEIFTYGEMRECNEATAWDSMRKRFEVVDLGGAGECIQLHPPRLLKNLLCHWLANTILRAHQLHQKTRRHIV